MQMLNFCTCNRISTCDMLGSATVISSQELIIQMTSLMHYSSTPRTGLRNPNQCSALCFKCQFTPPGLLPVHNPHGLLQPYIHAR